GAPPFTGPSAQSILARHSVDPVPSLHTVRSTVPAGLGWAISKAMAQGPADRFATAGRCADALAHPEQAPVPRARRTQMLRAVLGLSALGAAVVLSLGLNVGGLRDRLGGGGR